MNGTPTHRRFEMLPPEAVDNAGTLSVQDPSPTPQPEARRDPSMQMATREPPRTR